MGLITDVGKERREAARTRLVRSAVEAVRLSELVEEQVGGPFEALAGAKLFEIMFGQVLAQDLLDPE